MSRKSLKSLPLFLAFAIVPIIVHTPACKSGNVTDTDEDMGVENPNEDLANVLPGVCTRPYTETVAPMGGAIAVPLAEGGPLYGTMLVLPPGAVSSAAILQIGCGADLALADEVILGPSARLSPDGQTFNKPVELTLPFEPSKLPAGSQVMIAAKSGTQRELFGAGDITVGAKAVTLKITHFSDYQVIARKPGSSGPTKNVDVLFVVDDSPSMTTKQRLLMGGFDKFIRPLEKAGLSYHLAVITTDVGSQVGPGQPWGGSIGSCDTYEGDDGTMQNIPCTGRSDGTSEARGACATYCPDDRFVPTDGKRYITNSGGVTNVPKDMIPDPMGGGMIDNGPLRAFQCMGLVGDGGCGIESPLEAARRALDGHNTNNSGFLRTDSLLAVVFLSDEDDCSVQLTRRNENNPATMDCSTPDANASYECFNIDYRCFARSVSCDQPMNTVGEKTNCRERPSNYLEPVSKYTSFLKGLRPSNRLVVGGIWSLPSPRDGGKVVIARGTGGTATPFLNRAPGMDAACYYGGAMIYFGQAQLRLGAFAASFGDAKQYSVCDPDKLGTSLGELAQQIIDKAMK